MRLKDLSLNQLSWVVTKIELDKATAEGGHVKGWVREAVLKGQQVDPYATDWVWGGPIIDRSICSIRHAKRFKKRGLWIAFAAGGKHSAMGRTALEAAMRCYVASNLGVEVDIPEGLQ